MIYCLHMTTAGNRVIDQAPQAHDGEERGPGLPGITVCGEPTFGVSEVASHAVALLLALHRKLVLVDRYVRDGWHAGRGVVAETR
jgi:lactate dehydrogenase-like 2-hydroxyacid dehydrogenase